MTHRLTGRGTAALLAVLSSLLSVVDVGSKALAPWLSHARHPRALTAALLALGGQGLGRIRWTDVVWPVAGAAVIFLGALAIGDPGIALATVMVKGSFGDLLDPRFREVATEEYQKFHEDMVPVLHKATPPTTPQRDTEKYSEVSDLPMAGQFTGSLDYAQFYLGYDTTASYMEYAQGIQVERTLVEYDQFNLIEERPRALARSMFRRRQYDAHRWLRNAFSVDTYFFNRSEGVALCSNSHTTTTGVSTAAGFDNLITTAFSATTLKTAVVQGHDLRNLQGHPIQVNWDTIIAPIDLYEEVWEVVSSMGKIDSAQNNRNVHYGAYNIIFLRNKVDFPDTNDWFLADSTLMKDLALWFDQVYPGNQPEFGFTEEFDTFVAKYRAYMRYTNIIRDWRWLLGAQVA